ncbi:MAG: hypothetical protein R3362_05980 [Rhodothermales bacterium]|nr:hypothetical protein [Rhodothermales bacterium]
MPIRSSALAAALALALVPFVSGCLALGVGAAATVGGCALLDRDQNEEVTPQEFSEGLFDNWDEDDSGGLTRAEFDAGVRTSDTYAGWSDAFPEWDDNGNGTLSRGEFTDGAVGSGDVAGMLDDGCDDLGL